MSGLIRLNLLDWREAEREHRRSRFFLLLGLAALAAVLLGGLLPRLYFDSLLTTQRDRNDYLQDQIDAADARLVEIRALRSTRENLITRMQIIEELQQSRSAVVHYVDELVDTLPEGVRLSSLTENNDRLTLNGIAESNASVSNYMVNLDDSAWFADPRLVVIRSSDGRAGRFADFTLTVDMVLAAPAEETVVATES